MRVGIIAMMAAGLAHSQSFEVASIKSSGPKRERGWEGGPGSSDPTRYRYQMATLNDLIVLAYHVDYFQIFSSMPLDRQNFDFVANVPEGTSKPQFRLMLRNFLAERFQLRAHVESKEFQGYELVIAKAGPKLASEAKTAEGFPDLPPDKPGMIARNTPSGRFFLTRLKAQRQPISVLADFLHNPTDAPVVDKTGLTGRYSYTLEYTTDSSTAASDAATEPPVAPGIFAALQQQLGLQLIAKKIPLDVVVVDSINRMPTEIDLSRHSPTCKCLLRSFQSSRAFRRMLLSDMPVIINGFNHRLIRTCIAANPVCPNGRLVCL